MKLNTAVFLVPISVVCCLLFVGCAQSGTPSSSSSDAIPEDNYRGHSESEDLEPFESNNSSGKADRVNAQFKPNFLFHDQFFTNAEMLSSSEINTFLKDGPYGEKSPLLDHDFGNKTIGELISNAATEKSLNPLLLLGRMQVEGSLVSKSVSQHKIDFAFGCGCFDDETGCRETYRGFGKQLKCASDTLTDGFNKSKNGEGEWVAGQVEATQDGTAITPQNHATAAMYYYTPWVLEGRGGNWLVWNITNKFVNHAEELDLIEPKQMPWIGTACISDRHCNFTYYQKSGRCHESLNFNVMQSVGICVLPCDGYCPDRKDYRTSFCVSNPNPNEPASGICVSKAKSNTDHPCSKVPSTRLKTKQRYVNESDAPVVSADVCLPAN